MVVLLPAAMARTLARAGMGGIAGALACGIAQVHQPWRQCRDVHTVAHPLTCFGHLQACALGLCQFIDGRRQADDHLAWEDTKMTSLCIEAASG
ncbi:hypothetical protein XocVXO32_09580 [Xanthomonas oryzae pv. oryzicola]|uniref:hypothetical protein n=1 Tax=Xanthomonas oryzae TaxID=347 RepID=UPI00131F2D3F|nr:hypothetical protein [Xanthomonas oryzae]